MRRVFGFLAGGAGVACAALGCQSPTQIEVRVTTDLPCDDVAATGIAVGELGASLESAVISTTSTTCAAGSLGSVVLVPSGDTGAAVAFKVIVARKSTQSSVDSCIDQQMGRWRFPVPHDKQGAPTDASFSVALALQPS